MGHLVEYVSQSWPWYVAGPLLAVVMFTLLYFGNIFGISSNFKTLCAIGGAGKRVEFFRFEWKDQIWNLVFILGAVLGGFIASKFLMPDSAAHINEITKQELIGYGIQDPGKYFVPVQYFSWDSLMTIQGFTMVVVGGFLVGFGTRYAGGCTSGHAISGLSNLQLPSLIAVIGFFIGGLVMTNFIFPFLLTW